MRSFHVNIAMPNEKIDANPKPTAAARVCIGSSAALRAQSNASRSRSSGEGAVRCRSAISDWKRVAMRPNSGSVSK